MPVYNIIPGMPVFLIDLYLDSRYLMIMKIHLPNSAFLGNIDGTFLSHLDMSSQDSLDITLNEQWVSLHPAVLAMTASLGLTVRPEKIRVGALTAKSAIYPVRMGLFRLLNIPCDKTITEHAPEGRFIPLTQIKTSDGLNRFITDMIPILHRPDEPEHAKTIGYIISELVGNVLEHASAEHGAILCAQYYTKTNRIGIGIADTGFGVKTTISRSHKADTDLDAIRLALTPGVTGTTARIGGTAQNAGAGLFFIKSIADVNRDFFVIYSGSAFYKLLKKRGERLRLNADPFADRHTKGNDFPYWNGAVIGVDITLNRTREFSTLLDAIRTAYGNLKKSKADHKKLRFV